MMCSPAHAVLPLQGVKHAYPPRHRGTLGQPQAKSRLAHFLFRQPPQKRVTDNPDPNEAAVDSLTAAAWRARRLKRQAAPAEPRPFPFPHVDHLAHSGFSIAATRRLAGSGLRDCKN